MVLNDFGQFFEIIELTVNLHFEAIMIFFLV